MIDDSFISMHSILTELIFFNPICSDANLKWFMYTLLMSIIFLYHRLKNENKEIFFCILDYIFLIKKNIKKDNRNRVNCVHCLSL